MTPEEFDRLLRYEQREKPPGCDDLGQPFLGIPRSRTEAELLPPIQLKAVRLRRQGKTLRVIGDELSLSPERVRQLLLGASRRWEHMVAGDVTRAAALRALAAASRRATGL